MLNLFILSALMDITFLRTVPETLEESDHSSSEEEEVFVVACDSAHSAMQECIRYTHLPIHRRTERSNRETILFKSTMAQFHLNTHTLALHGNVSFLEELIVAGWVRDKSLNILIDTIAAHFFVWNKRPLMTSKSALFSVAKYFKFFFGKETMLPLVERLHLDPADLYKALVVNCETLLYNKERAAQLHQSAPFFSKTRGSSLCLVVAGVTISLKQTNIPNSTGKYFNVSYTVTKEDRTFSFLDEMSNKVFPFPRIHGNTFLEFAALLPAYLMFSTKKIPSLNRLYRYHTTTLTMLRYAFSSFTTSCFITHPSLKVEISDFLKELKDCINKTEQLLLRSRDFVFIETLNLSKQLQGTWYDYFIAEISDQNFLIEEGETLPRKDYSLYCFSSNLLKCISAIPDLEEFPKQRLKECYNLLINFCVHLRKGITINDDKGDLLPTIMQTTTDPAPVIFVFEAFFVAKECTLSECGSCHMLKYTLDPARTETGHGSTKTPASHQAILELELPFPYLNNNDIVNFAMLFPLLFASRAETLSPATFYTAHRITLQLVAAHFNTFYKDHKIDNPITAARLVRFQAECISSLQKTSALLSAALVP